MGDKKLAELVHEHLGLVVTVAVFAAFSFRLIVVSHSDRTAALAIMQGTGPAAALLAVATSIGIPVACFGLLGYLQGRQDGGLELGRDFRWRLFMGELIICLLLALVVTWLGGFLALLLCGLMSVRGAKRKGTDGIARKPRADQSAPSFSSYHPNVPFVIAALCLSVLLNDEMWLPKEQVTLTNAKPVVGYVLDSDDTTLTVLRESDRGVIRIKTQDMTDRQFCPSDKPWWMLSVMEAASSPSYRRCTR